MLLAIGVVEAAGMRAVHVEHADQSPVLEHRQHHLRLRRLVADDVAGECVHVRHQHRGALQGRRAAHAIADGNAGAGGLALEGPEHQVRAAQQVEAGPVQIRQAVEQQRGEIGDIGEEIGLIGDQFRAAPTVSFS